ncbi:MAG: hypothetical protein NXI25_27115, partial [bacterium]|nr:hypothetical protein [bacterium]
GQPQRPAGKLNKKGTESSGISSQRLSELAGIASAFGTVLKYDHAENLSQAPLKEGKNAPEKRVVKCHSTNRAR